MTDDEIKDLMYEYADAFTSCIQFKEESLYAFARALLDQAVYKELAAIPENKPEPPAYTDDLWRFTEGADRILDAEPPL